ncbi:MAG: hypothetical protein J7M09_01170 [Deltaproteobacteria bacterium]|nr:hypothetical protein [Candidatus Tharpella sp.]
MLNKKKGREDCFPTALKRKKPRVGLPSALLIYMSLRLLNAPGKPILISVKIKPKKEKDGNGAGHFKLIPVFLMKI